MADREHESPDRDVACPRCGARTRRGITPLGRVCEDCSRRVFMLSAVTRWRYSLPLGDEFLHERTADSITLPPSVASFLRRDAGTDRSGVIVPLFVFGVLVAMTWIVIGDGLSSFDPVIVVAAWGSFVVWALAPSGSGGEFHQ